MARNFILDPDRTLHAALFILNKLGGKCDFHKLFKILYFADQKHLAVYGTPISGDLYVAMKNGPVPSELYDILKSVRDLPATQGAQYLHYFNVTDSYNVIALSTADSERLSESHQICLQQSIAENRGLSFNELTQKSHQSAWHAAANDEMSFIDIAREGGANDEMIRYIEFNLENQMIFNRYADLR